MGFKEVRLIPSRPGIGFAEFENEMHSGMPLTVGEIGVMLFSSPHTYLGALGATGG